MSTSDRSNPEKFYQLTGLSEFPQWSHNRVKSLDEIENNYFYQTLPSSENKEIVLLAQVTGSIYFPEDQYCGLKWHEMAVNLKRKDVASPDHAIAAIKALEGTCDCVKYYKFADEYFITNGHHRTCLAKFRENVYVYGEVREFFFDNELFKAYQTLSHYFTVDIGNSGTLSAHILSPQWSIKLPNIEIRVRQRENIISLCNYVSAYEPSWWQRFKDRFWLYKQPEKYCYVSWPLDEYKEYQRDDLDYQLFRIKSEVVGAY